MTAVNENKMTNNTSDKRGADIKIILLGDSAVGKSKLMERFLMDNFVAHQDSTYALTLYRYRTHNPDNASCQLEVDFWDTAGSHL